MSLELTLLLDASMLARSWLTFQASIYCSAGIVEGIVESMSFDSVRETNWRYAVVTANLFMSSLRYGLLHRWKTLSDLTGCSSFKDG